MGSARIAAIGVGLGTVALVAVLWHGGSRAPETSGSTPSGGVGLPSERATSDPGTGRGPGDGLATSPVEASAPAPFVSGPESDPDAGEPGAPEDHLAGLAQASARLIRAQKALRALADTPEHAAERQVLDQELADAGAVLDSALARSMSELNAQAPMVDLDGLDLRRAAAAPDGVTGE